MISQEPLTRANAKLHCFINFPGDHYSPIFSNLSDRERYTNVPDLIARPQAKLDGITALYRNPAVKARDRAAIVALNQWLNDALATIADPLPPITMPLIDASVISFPVM